MIAIERSELSTALNERTIFLFQKIAVKGLVRSDDFRAAQRWRKTPVKQGKRWEPAGRLCFIA